MTTIITRLYESEAQAGNVVDKLKAEGFPENTYDVITSADASAMEAAHVGAEAAATYAGKMDPGNALLVVRAPFVPFGAARAAMTAADSEPSIDMGGMNQNVHVEIEQKEVSRKILTDHPLFLTSKERPKTQHKTVSESLGFSLLSDRKPASNSIRHGHWANFLFPLISHRKPTGQTIRHGFWANFAVPHLTKKDTSKLSIRKGGGFPLSEIFGWKLIIRR